MIIIMTFTCDPGQRESIERWGSLGRNERTLDLVMRVRMVMRMTKMMVMKMRMTQMNGYSVSIEFWSCRNIFGSCRNIGDEAVSPQIGKEHLREGRISKNMSEETSFQNHYCHLIIILTLSPFFSWLSFIHINDFGKIPMFSVFLNRGCPWVR